MTDNLMFLLNKLSYQIVFQEFENGNNSHLSGKDERYFKKCVNRVKQKGCDILLKKCCDPVLSDPCVTDYGGNWSPLTVLTDYGRELKAHGMGKQNEILISNIKILEKKPFNCLNDMIKLLLLLKKPSNYIHHNSQQNEVPFNGLNFLGTLTDSHLKIKEDFLDGDSISGSHSGKTLQFKDNWSKSFDSKLEILGEFSKKNLSSSNKKSFDSLFIAKQTDNNLSQSNCFVFKDFLSDKKYKSDNVIYFGSNVQLDENPLLDSFVDNPITHKLPSSSTSKSRISEFSEQDKNNLNCLYEKDYNKSFSQQSSPRGSSIQLKRNSNFSHSFSILYDKAYQMKSEEQSLSNNDNKSFKEIMAAKTLDELVVDPTQSKDIILGLWEHEQELIKEFRPELASGFPELRMITLVEYVEDVKYLMTGINSATFLLNPEKNTFFMKYGTCLEDVTPESLYYFSKDFLEIGNCYVELHASATLYSQKSFDVCTTITQAFWKSIFDFLELHYSIILEIPFTTNLMTLKSLTRDLHEMMVTVADICKIVNPNNDLSEGSQLLTHLFQIAEKITRPCIVNLVFGILQNCCAVYFMCMLQTWMFKGHLDKSNNEFFVDCHWQKAKTKTRCYYNSFYIVSNKIPCFLEGYEESILNCGKSIHFLKMFDGDGKFCQMLCKGDYPVMNLCYSEKQLEDLEREFREYGNRVLKLCGGGVSIKSLRQEEKEQEKEFLEFVKEFKEIQEQQRELRELEKLKELKAEKESKNKLLNEQLELIKTKKEMKKAWDEVETKAREEAMKNKRENDAVLLNLEKTCLKNYYDEIMKSLEKKINMAELRKKNLKVMLLKDMWKNNKNERSIMDMINANEVFENENISDNVDINSNTNSSPSEHLVRVIDDISCSSSINKEDKISNLDLEDKLEVYDENSNPKIYSSDTEISNEKKVQEPGKEVRTAGSVTTLRTVAAEEALKNKWKVLRSEFDLCSTTKNQKEEKTAVVKVSSVETSLSDLERNRRKVMESEYDILKKPKDQFSLRSIKSQTVLAKESRSFQNLNLKTSSDQFNFDKINLERKFELIDLGKSSNDSVTQETNTTNDINEGIVIESSVSSLTSYNEVSADIVPTPKVSEEDNKVVSHTEIESMEPVATPVNSNYRQSLVKDAEILNQPKLLYQDIFHIKSAEVKKISCTDFITFQRLLKRSILIPLKIQEKLANDALLKHLIKGENLLSHLKSLKGYFFLNDGEFGRSLTYNLFHFLSKCTEPQEFFERNNLSTILNEALNYSIHNSDLNSRNLSFQIVKMPPFLNHSSHDVLSPFELSYRVKWPLNIILTEKSLNKYKQIFQFLLKLKRINWTLNENFLLLNYFFKNSKINKEILTKSSHYHKIQIYRHAMSQVMVTFDDYIFSNEIQFSWMYFLQDLESTENIDHLYQKHVRYIKDVLNRCFLSKNSEDLLDSIYNLIELALKFHYTAKSSMLEIVNGQYEHPKFHVLKATFNEFCLIVKNFLKTLREKILTDQVLKSHYVLIEKFDMKLA